MSMKKNQTYTEKQMEILRYVKDNGGYKVPVFPRAINQNKNFYSRINKLEYNGLVEIDRFDGAASDFTITEEGLEQLECYYEMEQPKSPMESISNFEFLDNLFCSNKFTEEEKHKLISLLVS